MENKNIDLKKLIKTLGNKNVRDYAYLTFFFIIFSIFIFFAIRPVLVTAFELRQEEILLQEKNLIYQKAIGNADSNLKVLEAVRDRLSLIDEAIPDSPQINKIINDIQTVTKNNQLNLNNIFVSEQVDYKNPKNKDFKQAKISIEESGTFEQIMALIEGINAQRRLKIIDKMDIFSQKEISTSSGSLDVQSEITGFYL